MFEIVLTNGEEDCSLPFAVRTTPIAQKWFAEIQKGYPIYEDDRFTKWNDRDLVALLNNCIAKINAYDNIIDRHLSQSNKTIQNDLNYLHKFFEDLRGEVDQGTEWFNSAPEDVQRAVERFNLLIHELETSLRAKDHPTLVVTFLDRPKIELAQEDFNEFTYKWTQGTVYINYCHVGKPVLDVFKDKDRYAKGVRPQTHYSADFMIKFGPSVGTFAYTARKVMLHRWIARQGFNFEHLSLGMIPVADIATDVDFKVLSRFNRVKEVR